MLIALAISLMTWPSVWTPLAISSDLAAKRAAGLEDLTRQFRTRFGSEAPRYTVGWASPMTRVFLNDVPVSMSVGAPGKVAAFQGEVEAVQLVLAALDTELRSVRVSVSDLAGPGDTIPASAVEIHPVGFVRLGVPPARPYLPMEVSYLGWWPDPLLRNVPFDVEKNATQPVWISVHVPQGCRPGRYAGSVTIQPADAPLFHADLEVDVWDFELPRTWAFHNILSWHDEWAKRLYKDAWTPGREKAFFDFLLERRINVTSMYGNEPYATPEQLVAFAARGQNALIASALEPDARVSQDVNGTLVNRLQRYVPSLRAAGVVDRTLVYGWDERGPEWYGDIRSAAQVLGRRFGLPLMMAGVDDSYGLDSAFRDLDNIIYCPQMSRYDPERAARSRTKGNRVWWYEINWNIEQQLIRSRLIPWQTFKAGADGFLIWCINRWVGNDRPVGTEIRTAWNPYLDGALPHSSAMYVYPGTDGPLSSMRLENFRDGIEDYDLLTAAQQALQRLERAGSDGEIVGALRRATELPDDFIGDAMRYSADPAKLLERRRLLAEALIASRQN